MASFSITNFPNNDTITEGSNLAFTLTRSSDLTSTATVRWDIIQDGRFAALNSDFSSTSGTISFAANEATQNVSIAINDDSFRGQDRSFSLRLTEVPSSGPEVQIGSDRAITLIEDDTSSSFRDFVLSTSSQHDTLVLGSSYTYTGAVTGGIGNDTLIITKYQNLDLTIADTLGINVLKFDEDVSITHVNVNETVVIQGVLTLVNSITLTLGTGADITVTTPAQTGTDGVYQFQLADGALTNYTDFVAAITAGGFENDSDGNATTELNTAYAITTPALAPNSGTSQFTVSSLPDTITEGTDLNLTFTLTPSSALTSATTVRWDIIQDGRSAALNSDFAATTGVVNFANGATAAQNVSITINDDSFRGQDRSFSLRLTEVATGGAETQIGSDHAITLIEDDTGSSFRDFVLSTSSQHDTLVLGSSYTYTGAVTGGIGNDTLIITKYQNLDLTIADTLGINVLKFDEDVSITHVNVNETVVIQGVLTLVNSITLTLGTGADITVTTPAQTGTDGVYQFQLADGALTNYTDFVAEITSGGFENDSDGNATTELSTAYATTPTSNFATAITLTNPNLSIAEDADTASAIKIGDLDITDADGGSYGTLRLAGTDAGKFELKGTELFLKAGTDLDFETASSLNVRVQLAQDNAIGTDVVVTVTNENETDASVAISRNFTGPSRGGDVYTATITADLDLPTVAGNYTYQWFIGGVGIGTATVASTTPITYTLRDIDAGKSVEVRISYTDPATSGTKTATSVDAIGTSITLANENLSIAEDADTRSAIKIADLTVADADGGSYGTLRLAGTDAGKFELKGTELFLAAGTDLDYETDPSLTVRVQLAEATGVGTDVVVTVTDANDAPTLAGTTTGSVAENTNVVTPISLIRLTPTDPEGQLFNLSSFTLTSGDGFDNTALNNLFKVVSLPFVQGEPRAFGLQVNAGQESALNHEVKDSYAIDVTVSDGSLSSTTTSLTVNVTDVNEIPTTTPRSGIRISDRETYTFEVTDFDFADPDAGDVVANIVIETLPSSAVGSLMLNDSAVNLDSGAVTVPVADITDGNFTYVPLDIKPDIDNEANISFTYNVGSNSLRSTTATFGIAVINETPPVISSSSTGTLDENEVFEGDTAVYTAAGTLNIGAITWSLKTGTGDLFEIDPTSGVVTFKDANTATPDVHDPTTIPDFEGPPSPPDYTFTVVAMSATGQVTEQAVTIQVRNVDERDASVELKGAVESGPASMPANGNSFSLTLTALDLDLADKSAYTFHWFRRDDEGNFVEFTAGVAGESYVFADDDIGHVIRGSARYTDPSTSTEKEVFSNSVTVRSYIATVSIARTTDADPATTINAGDVYTATITPHVSLGNLSAYSYQWLRGGAEITGATEQTYTLTGDDAGHDISVRISYMDPLFNSPRTASSDAVTVSGSAAPVNDAPTLGAVTGATITDNANSDSGSTITTGSLTGTLAGADTDGDTLTYVVTGGNSIADTTQSSTHRIDGTYGKFYYHEDNGSYTFIRDEAAINALGAGQNVNDTFTVSVSDEHGLASATQDLVFTVVGADEVTPNTAPTLGAVTGATITDNANSDAGSTVTTGSLTGTLVGADTDGDTLTYVVTGGNSIADTTQSSTHRIDGTYGKFYYHEDNGSYTFIRDEAAINALGASDNVNDTFTVSVSDEHGLASATRDLVFNVVGADENNAPTLGAVTGATITDNANSDSGSTVTTGSLTGTLVGTDADSDTLTYVVTGGNSIADTTQSSTHRIDGSYGKFYYHEDNGSYTFIRDEAAINALGASDNVNDTFTVSVSDEHGLASATQDLVFTVVGADEVTPNTAPTLGAVTGATITDNANSDTGSTVSTGSLTGTLVGADTDGDTLTYVVTGGNSIADTTQSSTHRIDGTYGKFYYHEDNGSYTFIRDEAAINAVGATQNVNDTFTVSVSDGSLASATQDLVFTVVGANDAPVLNAVTGATITDNANSDSGSTVTTGSLTGTLVGTDADSDTLTYVVTGGNSIADTTQSSTHRIDGTYGKFYYHEDNGSYTFIRDEAVINALGAGQNVNDTFTVSVSDEHGLASATQDLVFTVVGANDAPTLTNVVAAGNVDENATGANVSSITFTAGDADASQRAFVASDFTLTGDADLFEVYAIDAGQGEFGLKLKSTATLNYEATPTKTSYAITVTVSDGTATSTPVTLTVNLDNVNETDATVSIARTADNGTSTTIDTGDVYTATITPDLDVPTIAGNYSYQWLRDNADISGATEQTYTLTDDDAGTDVSVRISYTDAGFGTKTPSSTAVSVPAQSVNEAPTLAGTTTGDVAESTNVVTPITGISLRPTDPEGSARFTADSFTLTSTDGADVDALFEVVSLGGSPESFGLQVKAGQGSALDFETKNSYAINITVSDGSLSSAPTSLTVNLTDVVESNAPTLTTVTQPPTITDNADSDTGSTIPDSTSLAGTLVGNDVDGDTLTYVVTEGASVVSSFNSFSLGQGDNSTHRITGTYGTFYYNENNGKYIFEPLEAGINALDAGDVVNTTFTVFVRDQGGLTSDTQDLVFRFEGANDAPALLVYGTSGEVNENVAGASFSTIIFGATDVDADQSQFAASDFTLAGDDDLFEVVASGGGGFSLKLKSTAMLDYEAKSSYAINVTVSDGSASSTAASLTISVMNVDETAASVLIARTADNGTSTTIDTGDVYTATITPDLDVPTIAGNYTYQWLRDNADITGATEQTYTLTDDDAGTDVSVRVSYTDASFGSENITSNAVTVPAQGVNEAPTLAGTTTGDVAENTNVVTPITGISLTPTDPEGSATFTAASFTLTSGDGVDNTALNALFEVVSLGGSPEAFGLQVKAEQESALNHEVKGSYAINVTVSDGSVSSTATSLTVNVTNVNETDATVSIARTADNGTSTTIDTGDVYTATITPDLDVPTIAGNYSYQWLRDNAEITGATEQTYTLTDDDAGTDVSVRISYTDASFGTKTPTSNAVTVPSAGGPGPVDARGTAITLTNPNLTIAEDANTASAIKIADLTVADADGGNYGTLELTGADADKFELNGTVLSLKAGTDLDYETASSLNVRVQLAENKAIGTDVVVTVTDANDTPTLSLPIGESRTVAVAADTTSNVSAEFAFGDVDATDGNDSLNIWVINTSSASSVPATADASAIRGAPNLPSHFGQYGDAFLAKNNSTGLLTITYNLLETAGSVRELDQGDTVYEKFTIFARDAAGNTSLPETYTVTINGANDAPTLTTNSEMGTVAENATGASSDAGIILTARDADASQRPAVGDFSLTSRDGFTTLNDLFEVYAINVGQGTFGIRLKSSASAFDYETATKKSYAITVTLTDGSATVTQDLTLNVANVDEAQASVTIAKSGGGAAAVGDTYTATITPDQDVPTIAGYYTYQWFSGGTAIGSQAVASTAPITYTLRSEDAGKDVEVRVSYTDASFGSENIKSDAVAVPQHSGITTPEGTRYILTADDFGNPGGSFNLNTRPSAGALWYNTTTPLSQFGGSFNVPLVVLNNRQLSYVAPNVDMDTDITIWSSAGNVTITVINNVGTAPTLTGSTTGTVAENTDVATPTGISLTPADPDGQAFSPSSFTLTSGDGFAGDLGDLFEVVAGSGGAFDLRVKAGQGSALNHEVKDSYVINVSVSDGSLSSAAIGLTVNVTDVNDAPTLTTDSQTGTVAENVTSATVAGIILTAGDVDASQTPAASDFTLTGDDDLFEVYALATSGEFGLRLKSTATAFDFETATKKSYAITVTLTDGSATATQDLTINVTDANDAPTGSIFQAPLLNTLENVGEGVTLSNNFINDQDNGIDTSQPSGWAAYFSDQTYADLAALNADTSSARSTISLSGSRFTLTKAMFEKQIYAVHNYTDGNGNAETVFENLGRFDAADTAGTATRLADVIDGNTLNGHFEAALNGATNDQDYFTFTLAARQTVTFTETGTVANDINLDLVNSAGTTVTTAGTESSDVTTVTATLDAGTYILRASGAEGDYSFTYTTAAPAPAQAPFTIPSTKVMTGTGTAADTLAGGAAGTASTIQGGNDNDTITTGGGDDLVIGGYGDDTITLGAGAETVLYRFESDSNSQNEWKASDSNDIINNFTRGTDKLVLIDESTNTPITSFADFAADTDRPTVDVRLAVKGGVSHVVTVAIQFDIEADEGLAAGTSKGGLSLTINFNQDGPTQPLADIATNIEGSALKGVNYDFLDDLFGGTDSLLVVDGSNIGGLDIL